MRQKPLIGINADLRESKKDSPAYTFLACGYHRAIERAGGIPVIVPVQEDSESVSRLLDMLDGFVLVGGADLDPRNDGYMLHTSVRLMNPSREAFDRQLARSIANRRLPVLGIGVGMQLLNITAGGNLFLHIPEDVPTAIPHRDAQDVAHRHALTVVANSLMGRVYGDGEIRVNSQHHMAVDEVARGFRVTARCPDGIIEAIESTRDDWFAIGTQFHPEAETATAIDIRIFEEFICGITGEESAPEGDLELAAA
jgi:putative glutamine amidotransferase